MLSRDEILNSKTIVTETVKCPEWGGDVLVRRLTPAQVDAYRKGLFTKIVDRRNGRTVIEHTFDAEKITTANMKLIVMAVVTIVEGEVKPVFTDADMPALMQQPNLPIERLLKVINRISGLTEEAMEQAEKNSDPNPSDTSLIN